jgi:hypothetical protein
MLFERARCRAVASTFSRLAWIALLQQLTANSMPFALVPVC